MKNFVQDGDMLSVTAPYDRSAGQGVLVGHIFGIAATDVVTGNAVEIATEGVFDVTKAGSLAISAGDLLYWDDTNKRLNKTASGNVQVAVAAAAAGSSDTTVRAKLMRATAAAA